MTKKTQQETQERDPAKALIEPMPRASLLQRLRNNFLTGIVVVAPFGITLYLTWTIIDYIDAQVLPQVMPLLPEAYQPENSFLLSLPGIGVLMFVLFLIAVGSLTKNFFGRELVRYGERWVDRMPVVRSIYNALKQIAETIFTQSKSSFEKACLVEYPRKGIWAIAFVSTPTTGEVLTKARNGREMLSVFLPTTPNPTSGFLLFVPKEDVILLDMTVEEAAKMVISAGLVAPPDAATAAAQDPADTARAHREVLAAESARRSAEGSAEEMEPAAAGEAAARNPLVQRF